MRIIFMGTPDFARTVLDALLDDGLHQVIAAYTQPPRPGGRRGRELVASPVQQRAEAAGIPVFTPLSLRKPDAQAAFAALGADVAVVAAYGLILPQVVLDAPVHGCLNVHGSLLPRWRGAAPVQRAILAGDAETGVGIMQMAAGLDTGPVRLEGRMPIGGLTAGALMAALAEMGGRLMLQVLGDLDAYPPVAQPEEGVTYAAKIDKAEARIDFGRSAAEVERLVRALNPAPGAWFAAGEERVKILACDVLPLPVGERVGVSGSSGPDLATNTNDDQAARPLTQPSPPGGEGYVLDHQLTIACGDGAIRPTIVQRAGRGVTVAAELLRGFPIPPGTRL